jgi:gliding motility-associated-like protein
VSSPGDYSVIAYNSKSCPTESAVFTLINPPFPDFLLINPAVGCEPNLGIDIRKFILNHQPEDFDYQLEAPNGDLFLNEEMSSVSLSGDYKLRVRHKDLGCWSDQVPIQVVIVSQKLVADFDYEVDGTGVKDDEDGGIFIDDPIRFNDLSTGGAVAWAWDFGDGNTSTEKSPVHVFGKKGLFQVKLTVTNEWGCTATTEKVVPLTQSFRIMYPTGFTPTLSENRFFRPKTKGIVKMQLQIFNLWGNLMFETNDLQTQGWDGRLNGELLPGGTYVYRIRLESIDGDVIDDSGNFVLIR